MTRTKRLRVLREIYAEIPEVQCKGLCVAACATIPCTTLELEQLQAASGRQLEAHRFDDGTALLSDIGKPCPMLVVGRCTAYEHRPVICRLYGAAEGLRCEHGCGPARVVPQAEARSIIERVRAL